jgi:hypothetical protein
MRAKGLEIEGLVSRITSVGRFGTNVLLSTIAGVSRAPAIQCGGCNYLNMQVGLENEKR